MSNKRVRTRFAPSPTGPLHVGGIRTALFNYLFAKKHGGDFIIRIEDTDSKREVDGSTDYIFDSLSWLGIKIDESLKSKNGDYGPYIQSQRSHIYKKYVDMLIDSGNAYYAFDTSEDLDKMRDELKVSGVKNAGYTGSIREKMKNSLYMPKAEVESRISSGEQYVIRFLMPRFEDVKFKDEIRGWVTFNTKDLDDKVIWKSSDGLPTYHLANVIDDYLMEISHVIRGEEWLSSTPLHILLYRSFGWEYPIFAHLPLILDPSGKKLGKRNKYGIPVFALDWTYTDEIGEVTDIKGFREAGYEPDALINFLSLLGWSPGDNIEFMSLDEMINLFSLERVNQSGARFDLDKLKSFNSHYLRNKKPDYILENMAMTESFVMSLSNDKFDLIAKMAVERAVFVTDLRDSMSYLYKEIDLSDIKLKNTDEFKRVMSVFIDKNIMDEMSPSDWTCEHIRKELEFICKNTEVPIGKIMPMLRMTLTGGVPGPQLPDIMYIIGIEETKNRIESMLNRIQELN